MNKRLVTLLQVILLLKERNRSTNISDIIDSNNQLIDILQKNFHNIDRRLLDYFYTYLYNHSDFADKQYIKFNEKSNEFAIFTAYPSDDKTKKRYDYEKISLSKDQTIPIKKEKIQIELKDDDTEASVQRTVSLLLPENIELIKLESSRRKIKLSNMKRMIDFGRNLPLDRLQYRELKDLSIITSASADKPFHNSASLYAQDSCEIEKILPYSEIKFNSVQAASNAYWRDILDIIDIKDMPNSTKKYLKEMIKYQKERRKNKGGNTIKNEKTKKGFMDNFDNQVTYIDAAIMKYIDNSVQDFIDNYRNKIEMSGGTENFRIYDLLDIERHHHQ